MYKYAQIFYAIPFIYILLFVIDEATFAFTNFIFGVLFLATLFPCGLLGLICTLKGTAFWKKRKHNQQVDRGIAMIYFGIIMTAGGISGIGILYLVTH